MSTNLELHPLCSLFPRLTGYEFDCLKRDIQEHGLRIPITTYQGMILDGGNRYKACIELGIEPAFEEYSGTNLNAFILSSNMHRRHLTITQQAAIVASVQDWSKAHGKGGGPANEGKDTAEDRALQTGASVATQRKVDKVAKADPKLAAKVARGETSLNQALRDIAPEKPEVLPEDEFVNKELEYEEAGPSDEEIAKIMLEDEEHVERIKQVLASDDPISQSLVELSKQIAITAIVRERMNGLMNEKAELIRIIKAMRCRNGLLQKEIDRLNVGKP